MCDDCEDGPIEALGGGVVGAGPLEVGELLLDLIAHTAKVSACLAELTPSEFKAVLPRLVAWLGMLEHIPTEAGMPEATSRGATRPIGFRAPPPRRRTAKRGR